MSEAELHMMRARMRGGVLAKAKRGERCRLCRSGTTTRSATWLLDTAILHNPRYAGAAAAAGGVPDGTEKKLLAREEWTVLLCDAHPGYIT